MEKEKEKQKAAVTRRDFIAATGAAVVGIAAGAVIGSQAFPKVVELPGVTKTETKTTTAPGATATTTVTAPGATATTTVTAPGAGAVTTTVTAPGATTTVTTTAVTTGPSPKLTKLKVNGKDYEVEIEPQWTLQRTLAFKLGLTGTKSQSELGGCGSCTVIMDGRPVLSCIILAVECEGKSIETVEGIAANPKWSPLIHSYMKHDCMQCGYCTPGFVVNAKALLDRNPNPTEADVKLALSGNICRCGTYPKHPIAVLEAAKQIRGG